MNLNDKIEAVLADAGEYMKSIPDEEQYDVIFIDAAKGQYLVYLKEAIRLTKIGGIIIADNMLYRGRTLSDYNEHKHRTATNRLREYLEIMKEDERLDSTLIKIGDGLAISIVKENKRNDFSYFFILSFAGPFNKFPSISNLEP